MFIHLLSLGAYQPDGGKKVSTEFQLPESSVNYLKSLQNWAWKELLCVLLNPFSIQS